MPQQAVSPQARLRTSCPGVPGTSCYPHQPPPPVGVAQHRPERPRPQPALSRAHHEPRSPHTSSSAAPPTDLQRTTMLHRCCWRACCESFRSVCRQDRGTAPPGRSPGAVPAILAMCMVRTRRVLLRPPAARRRGTPVSVRSDAMKAQFHSVPAGAAGRAAASRVLQHALEQQQCSIDAIWPGPSGVMGRQPRYHRSRAPQPSRYRPGPRGQIREDPRRGKRNLLQQPVSTAASFSRNQS